MNTHTVANKKHRLNIIHGWGFSNHLLHPFAEELSKQFDVQLIDLPGYGQQPELPQDKQSFIDTAQAISQELQAGLLMGWSLGGMLATHISATTPEKVTGLITIASNLKFVSSPDWPHALNNTTVEDFGRSLEKDRDKTIDRFLSLSLHGNERQHQRLRQLKSLLSTAPVPNGVTIRAGLNMLMQADLRAYVAQIRCPIKQFYGDKDKLVPISVANTVQWLYPNIDVAIVRNASHAPFISHSAEMTSAIEEFYAKKIKHLDY